MQQINDTTYAIPGLGDRLIAPVITLGGKDAKKFAPNLNIGYDFGGGEEFYDNLNRTDKIISAKSEVKHDGKKVRLIEGSDIDEIYTDDLGRVKWDVVFEKCPETFTLEWRRTCSPGLTAHHQDSLENEWKQNPTGTLEEFLATNYRPDDVIGSYAIYCDKAHNWIRPLNRKREIPADWQAQRAAGAELGDLNIAAYREYKTGKVGHHYRPYVIDADGKIAWCTLLIIGNIERITLPEDFMKSAKYPVTLDPDIGYTTAGASTTNNVYFVIIPRYNNTSAGAGTANNIYGYIGGSGTVYLGYYADLASLPASLLESGSVSAPASAAWTAVSVSGAIAASTDYYPAVHLGGTTTIARDFHTNGSYAVYRSAAGFPATIESLGDGNNEDRYYSVYLEYTESGGGANGYYYMRNQ